MAKALELPDDVLVWNVLLNRRRVSFANVFRCPGVEFRRFWTWGRMLLFRIINNIVRRLLTSLGLIVPGDVQPFGHSLLLDNCLQVCLAYLAVVFMRYDALREICHAGFVERARLWSACWLRLPINFRWRPPTTLSRLDSAPTWESPTTSVTWQPITWKWRQPRMEIGAERNLALPAKPRLPRTNLQPPFVCADRYRQTSSWCPSVPTEVCT